MVGQRAQMSAMDTLLWFLIGAVVVRWSVRRLRLRRMLVAS
jgi:hypothetical protein